MYCTENTSRILKRYRGDDDRAIAAKRRKRLDIGDNARTTRRIKTGDRQTDFGKGLNGHASGMLQIEFLAQSSQILGIIQKSDRRKTGSCGVKNIMVVRRIDPAQGKNI